MSKKNDLRIQRNKTVINTVSKRQEKVLGGSIASVQKKLKKTFPGIKLHHQPQMLLKQVISDLEKAFPEVDFKCYHKKSSMKPDGGILSIISKDGQSTHPILIAEKKNQGTNDLRKNEGKKKQAMGNAIERLGKNVIGFRTALLAESIFPFVCFGDGCDFADDSSIIDRVVTIAMFGHLNKEYVHALGGDRFNRGSFYFREKVWTEKEMGQLCYSIAEKAVFYYFSKYGKESFI